MPEHDPEDVIEAAEREWAAISEQYLPVAEWFLANLGMGPRETVIADLAAHLGVEEPVANVVVGHLVEDDVDPVQQVVQPPDERYVGVIDHTEHDWFYAFDRYDDIDGRQRRAVCAHCVHEERTAAEVTHFTRQPDEYDVDHARMALALHYQVDHEGRALPTVLAEDLDVDPAAFAEERGLAGAAALSLRDMTRNLDDDTLPEPAAATRNLSVPEVDIEPGASLVSGTTIGGNTAWHAGNDGAGSGLAADRLDGKQATEIRAIPQRDQDGNAVIQTTGSYSLYTEFPLSSSTYTVSFSPSTSYDAAFLDTSTSYGYLSLRTIKRDGTTVSPNTTGYLVTRVTTGDFFEFIFHASYGNQTQVSGSLEFVSFA